MSSYLIDDPKYAFLKDLGLDRINNGVYNGSWTGSGEVVQSIDPASGEVIAEVRTGTPQEYDECVRNATEAYKTWSNVPAPQRGEIVRQIGDELRTKLQSLGKLVSLGKLCVLSYILFVTEYASTLTRFSTRNGKNAARGCG